MSRGDLASACKHHNLLACEHLGKRYEENGDRARARAIYFDACLADEPDLGGDPNVTAAGDTGNCYRLTGIALTEPSSETRTTALDLACARGVGAACDVLVDLPAPPAVVMRRAARGCVVAKSAFSCLRLADAYDTGRLGTTVVFSSTDPARALTLYRRACSGRWAAAGERPDTLACERAGDELQRGDLGRPDLVAAIDAYRNCVTTGCANKRGALRADPALAQYDAERDSQEQAQHAADLAAAAAREQQQEEADREFKEQERQDRIAREAESEANRQATMQAVAGAMDYYKQQQAQMAQNYGQAVQQAHSGAAPAPTTTTPPPAAPPRPPDPPKPPDNRAARESCIASFVSKTVSGRTNPFPAHAAMVDRAIETAQTCGKLPTKERAECMRSPSRLWPDVQQILADIHALRQADSSIWPDVPAGLRRNTCIFMANNQCLGDLADSRARMDELAAAFGPAWQKYDEEANQKARDAHVADCNRRYP